MKWFEEKVDKWEDRLKAIEEFGDVVTNGFFNSELSKKLTKKYDESYLGQKLDVTISREDFDKLK